MKEDRDGSILREGAIEGEEVYHPRPDIVENANITR